MNHCRALAAGPTLGRPKNDPPFSKAKYAREVTRPKRKAQRKLFRQYVWDYLLEHPCIDCGETSPILLEFDHVSGKKKFAISCGGSYSFATAKKEMEKCEVRCVSCHRIKTFMELEHWKNLRLDQIEEILEGGGGNVG